MRIIFGVDRAERWKAAADLLPRLQFEEGVVDTLHFLEPPTYFLGEPLTYLTSQMLYESSGKAQAEGQRMVAEASSTLRGDGMTTGVCDVRSGSAAAGLLHYADHVNAALIAVGSSGKSAVGSFFTGSVGRGLVIGAHQSVLIARDTDRRSGPVRAVLATDHSPFATRCLDTLLTLAPQGISHLTVMTAYPKHAIEGMQPFLPDFVLDPTQWIEQGLARRNAEVAAKLSPLGCVFDSRVVDGDVHDAIQQVMHDTKADLLILGAQGHGFVDRLTLGSVSFREALAEPHSVLMLRAADGALS